MSTPQLVEPETRNQKPKLGRKKGLIFHSFTNGGAGTEAVFVELVMPPNRVL